MLATRWLYQIVNIGRRSRSKKEKDDKIFEIRMVFHDTVKPWEFCSTQIFFGYVVHQHVGSVMTDGDLTRKFGTIEKNEVTGNYSV